MLRGCALVLIFVPLAACMGGSASGPSEQRVAAAAAPPAAAAQQGLRLLSNAQYTNSITDLLTAQVTFDVALPPDNRSLGLVSVGNGQAGMQDTALEAFEHLSYTIAQVALSDDPHRVRVLPCTPQDANDTACMIRFVATFGRRAFRRPLANAEVERYVALGMTQAAAAQDFYHGAEQAMAGMLQSPLFLFRTELGAGTQDANHPGQVRLTDYEVATRLAYLLWNSTPDSRLIDAAAQGNLTTTAGLLGEANRLLADPRGAGGLVAFFDDYLALPQLDKLQKDPNTFPGFTAAMGPAMHTELSMTLQDLLVTQAGDYRDLFVSPRAYVNSDIASLYNATSPAAGQYVGVDMPSGQGRTGLLGHAGILAVQAHPSSTSPTFRGLFVRNVLMCQGIPPPPANVPPLPAAGASGPQTMRQVLDAHRSNATCAACHALMDPIGLALEHYDALGQYRDTDQGLTIDASGSVDGVAYNDAQGLGAALHDNPRISDCLVRQVFRYATGRMESSGDTAAIAALSQAFAAGSYRLQPLLLALIASDSFRYVPEAP